MSRSPACRGDGSEVNTIHDWSLLGSAVVATLPFIVANSALIVCRRRRFFQAQGGALLVVASSAAGLLWIYSGFINNGHFTRPRFFKSCIFWTFWVQGLGVCSWFVFNIVRVHRMYLLSQEKSGWSWAFLVFAGIFLLPLVVFSILTAEKKTLFCPETCVMEKRWSFICWMTIYSLYLTISIVCHCMLRGQTDPLVQSEHMHTSEYITLTVIIFLASSNAVLTDGYLSVSGRCFLTFSTCSIVFLHFWGRFGWPVYLCLFRPESEMDALEQELSQSGARALSSYNSHRAHLQSSEGAVLEAFLKATEEVEDIKNKVRELRERKHQLEEQKRDLECRRSIRFHDIYP